MKIIPPVVITDAMLVSSSIPETDHPPWTAGTTYTVGQRCMLVATHSVYQRLVAGASAASPDTDSANWKRVGPTNRWCMFDGATGTLSTATDTLSVTIAPGLVSALALLDVSANSVDVAMHNGGELVYAKTVDLNTGIGVFDAYSYCFAPIVTKRTLVLTDLPPFSGAQITITLNGQGAVAVGTCAVGTLFDMGQTLYGIGTGLIDYSKKDTDEFGVTTLVKRANAKRITVPFVVEAWRGDEVMRRMADLLGTAVVWIGSTRNDSTLVYGYAMDTQATIKYSQTWECTTTINGLT
jgi:hypothetical protein